MAYNEKLAERIRTALVTIRKVKEQEMMGGLTFMVNGKMCMGIIKDDMMCRIDPDVREVALEKTGCRVMEFTGRPLKGFVLIDDSGMKRKKEFEYWVGLCLDFNKRAKASKKGSRKDAKRAKSVKRGKVH